MRERIKSGFSHQKDSIGATLLLLTLLTAAAYWGGRYLFGLPERWVWLLNFAGRASFSALLVFFGIEVFLSEKEEGFVLLGLIFFEGFFVVGILKTWNLVPWWAFLVMLVAWVVLIILYGSVIFTLDAITDR